MAAGRPRRRTAGATRAATRAPSPSLTLGDRQALIATALELLEKLYVHLPLKRAMYAVNPIQRLKLLRRRIDVPVVAPLPDQDFLIEMLSIFSQLRDLHTNFILPEPFRSRTAFLPFRIEACYEAGQPVYVVSQIMDDASLLPADPQFQRGVIVTHWNGIPIHRAVAINAEREMGSNAAARQAQGLVSMTIRWMGVSMPPDEDWVDITYVPLEPPERPREVRFRWQVFRPQDSVAGQAIATASGLKRYSVGLDARAEVERRIRRFLFQGRSGSAARPRGEAGVEARAGFTGVFPSSRNVTTPFGTYAYVRLATFNVPDDQTFLEEFIRISGQLSQDGLILDVRENGGGLIPAGERLLQLLTPGRIDPARLHFLNSTMTLALCQAHPFIFPWRDSIAQAVETGAEFSQGLALSPVETYNDIGQTYQGPVVLITDALCYSTTDIFAAGFQDHEVGTILGVHDNTGAGGANVWDYTTIAELAGTPTQFPAELPKRASFTFAVRRVSRVGRNAGVLIEDLGVPPDAVHRITRRDVTY
jgi:Peptidase family S41